MSINEILLGILKCPQCQGAVRRDEKFGVLICDSCKLLFEVKNGIPIMLMEEAIKLN